jgi:hypothetical protein
MTTAEPPLVSDKWPRLAAELAAALRDEGESDLANLVDTLHVLEECGCDDDFCQSFYTAPKPSGGSLRTRPPKHRLESIRARLSDS